MTRLTTALLLPNRKSRQKLREAWSVEKLFRLRSIALGFALERGTCLTYNSATQSYLTFCKLHHFPIEPTPDTLSFFVVYMSHHISPQSVASYLSGISSTLEPHFPAVRQSRLSRIVTRTLAGCKKQFAVGIHRKQPLTIEDIEHACRIFSNSTSFDDSLFLAILVTGFFALLRLGELTWPNNSDLQSYRKITMRHTVFIDDQFYGFTLPYHKADRFFQGNEVRIRKINSPFDPHAIFRKFLNRRDTRFCFRPELWIRFDGTIPTRDWFLRRLHLIFVNDANISGHSLRAGGATYYAIQGVPDAIIQKWVDGHLILSKSTFVSIPPSCTLFSNNHPAPLFDGLNIFFFHHLPTPPPSPPIGQ